MAANQKKMRFGPMGKLGESLIAEVFLAEEKNTAFPFLIKKIRSEFAIEGVQDYLQQQLAHLKQLDIPDLLVPELKIDGHNNLQLISAYPKGQLLRSWLVKREGISISVVIEIGIALADCLGKRHRAALVHKAIKPNNILIQEDPVRIQLVDEVQIVDCVQLSQLVNHPHYQRETLPYIAPEMTGRIRSFTDYTSDLYSLGIVLYECITGAPPFQSDDSLSIVHSHLAEEPRSATDINPACPEILSNIIDVLLCKPREKRYQSAVGLSADLQNCLEALRVDKSNPPSADKLKFPLQQHEASYQVSIPTIVVGREKELQQLLDQYQRACTGKLGVVMLSGLSGIGKTRLIQELELPIVVRHGYFASGKFNQFATHLPYSTLVSALSRLVRQILTEEKERISYWRKRILAVVGTSGQLMTNIVPMLENIIGQQPDVPELAASDAKNRFNDLFSRFMSCLATESNPLVLFVDDMQWCDQASFDLLELIFSQPERHPYLLVIGAYRDNEVEEGHRVRQLEAIAEQSSQGVLKLHLMPIEKKVANTMLAYMLSSNPTRVEKLTETIYSIAGGNPLFLSESLRWLYDNQRLQLSPEGRWLWSDRDMEKVDIPANGTALFVEKLRKLPDEARDLLATGALLGAQFQAEDLAKTAHLSIPQLYLLLAQVFEYQLLQQDKGLLSFFHDQIQAAAAEFLTQEEAKQRHRLISRMYVERIELLSQSHSDVAIPASLLFATVEHMAVGRLEKLTEKDQLAEAKLNFQAGVAAMDSLALEAGIHYLEQSADLCQESMWKTHYEFMLSLHQQLAHAAIVNADQVRANEIVELSLKQVQSDIDKAEFLIEQSAAYAALGDLLKAIEIVSRALVLLKRPLPVDDDEMQKEIEMQESRIQAQDRDTIQTLLDLPSAKTRLGVLVHKLYGELLGYYYLSMQLDRVRLTAYRAFDCSFEFGSDEFVAYALACMSYIQLLDSNEVMALRYESATLELLEKHPDTFASVKSKVIMVWAFTHRCNPISEPRSYAAEIAAEGFRCGELRYGALATCLKHWFGLFQADDIVLLDSQLEKFCAFCQQCNLGMPLSIGEAMRISLRPLLGASTIEGDDSEVLAIIQQWNEEGMVIAIACYHTFSGMVSYYNHDYVAAEKSLAQAEPFLPVIGFTIVERAWAVFHCLVGLEVGFKGDREKVLKQLREWTSLGPILVPYLMLIEAEMMSKEGQFNKTRSLYLEAIDCAHVERYGLLEAFLNERLYQYLQDNDHHSSEYYRDRANVLYQKCGAVTRIAIPNVSLSISSNSPSSLPSTGDSLPLVESSQSTQMRVHNYDNELDIQYLFNSVKTITSELDFDKLMQTILKSIMAKLGAKTAYLLIAQNNELIPRLKAIKYESISIIESTDADFNTETLCMAMVNYVFNSQVTLILENAFEEGEFTTDKRVQECRLRSVLCMPIIMQQQVLGVLYFENNLIEAVFTDAQIMQADLLTTQAAVALQNSRLLEETRSAQTLIEEMNRDLESTVKQRTKELQRKQLELTHAARLASLGELATGIAHELGQPLQIIQAASRIIQNECESEALDKAVLIPFSNDILEQIERATAIIRNMRAYGRNDDSNDAENINVAEPFHQCMVFFVEQFHQHQIQLTLEIEDSLPKVLVSPQKFQQIVVNLFSNARYAVDQQFKQDVVESRKKITARLYLVSDSELLAVKLANFKSTKNKQAVDKPLGINQSVVLEVEDNGVGMSEEVKLKCMDPFYTNKAVGEGTGLGLSIVHGLIEEFDFSLKIRSEPNRGSVFSVIMPVSDSV
ncbi:MAG: AAA family ATPase [Pseudomonadales bacterium]|nr:AAA family ATPase [Pseudomonadales bacterium]